MVVIFESICIAFLILVSAVGMDKGMVLAGKHIVRSQAACDRSEGIWYRIFIVTALKHIHKWYLIKLATVVSKDQMVSWLQAMTKLSRRLISEDTTPFL